MFKPLKKGTLLVCRLVRAGEDWMMSGNSSILHASMRDQMLAATAEQARRNPKAVFRNPAKLAEARDTVAHHHAAFVELFGSDLISVPGAEVPGKFEEFHRHVARRARPGAEPAEVPRLDQGHRQAALDATTSRVARASKAQARATRTLLGAECADEGGLVGRADPGHVVVTAQGDLAGVTEHRGALVIEGGQDGLAAGVGRAEHAEV